MSRRTAESNKAVRLKWTQEVELVKEGKGTRDWTKEQQQDILDPNKGKAYDDKGRAFEGQHMKSVAEYPEYQGNPDNIQFLTKDEHFEAHKGNWQNPTNWYYDPITKEYVDFGDGEIIPCKIIDLSDPVAALILDENPMNSIDKDTVATEKEERIENANAPPVSEEVYSDNNPVTHYSESQISPPSNLTLVQPKKEPWFVRLGKNVWNTIRRHPAETLEVVGAIFREVVEINSSKRSPQYNKTISYSSLDKIRSTHPPEIKKRMLAKKNEVIKKSNRPKIHESFNKHDCNTKTTPYLSTNEIDFPQPSEIPKDMLSEIENVKREIKPSPNDVSAHKQRYHTKNGVEWRDKESYHRGGDNN